MVRSLLEHHGGDIVRSSGGGATKKKVYVTPLMAAAQHGYPKIVHLLLQYDNAATNHSNPNSGYTALMLAALNGHLEVSLRRMICRLSHTMFSLTLKDNNSPRNKGGQFFFVKISFTPGKIQQFYFLTKSCSPA